MIRYLKFKLEIDYWVRDFSVGGRNYDLWEGGKDEWNAFRRDCLFMIEDDSVMLLIDVTNGRVVNWKEGVNGEFTTVKIVDSGSYQLLDENMKVLCGYRGYVPDLLGIVDKSWGDYLEFRIGKDCFVEDWKCNETLLKQFIGNCDGLRRNDGKIEEFLNEISSTATQLHHCTADIQSVLNMAVKKYGTKADIFIRTFSNTEEWLVVMNALKPWMCAFADYLNKSKQLRENK